MNIDDTMTNDGVDIRPVDICETILVAGCIIRGITPAECEAADGAYEAVILCPEEE